MKILSVAIVVVLAACQPAPLQETPPPVTKETSNNEVSKVFLKELLRGIFGG